MGGSGSLLPREALSEYQELTFLSKQEILLAYKRFSELLPKEERENACSARLPESRILTLPELRANPFQHQICRAFSTSEEGDGSMSFEDFLDMLSVFSDTATLDIKSHYAFRIFDFDGDGVLDRKDLEKLVNCLTGDGEESRLSTAEMEQLIQNVRTVRWGRGHRTGHAELTACFSLPSRSWRSPTSTRMAPSTSPSSSTSSPAPRTSPAPSRSSCESPSPEPLPRLPQLFVVSDVSSFSTQSAEAPAPRRAVPWARRPPASPAPGETAEAAACRGGAPGGCLACSPAALLGAESSFFNLILTLYANQGQLCGWGEARRGAPAWGPPAPAPAQPLSALSTNSCLPRAGRDLPPPAKLLPGSPIFSGASLLQCGSV